MIEESAKSWIGTFWCIDIVCKVREGHFVAFEMFRQIQCHVLFCLYLPPSPRLLKIHWIFYHPKGICHRALQRPKQFIKRYPWIELLSIYDLLHKHFHCFDVGGEFRMVWFALICYFMFSGNTDVVVIPTPPPFTFKVKIKLLATARGQREMVMVSVSSALKNIRVRVHR